MGASITVRNLFRKYGDVEALRDLNIEIDPGSIFGLLGPNGSGKTTFLRIITSLLDPTSGYVRVKGMNPLDEPDRIKGIVGYVPETPAMYESLSPREYFSFVSSVRGISASQIRERARSLVKALDLEEHMDSFIGSLSFGTKQKVAIVAALLHDPEIIVMDEGMNGLDPRSAKILKELLREFAQRGKTVIFSTHIMEVAENVCDRVAILYEGRIVRTGTMEQLRSDSGKSEGNLEEIFLSLTGSRDLGPLIASLKESFRS